MNHAMELEGSLATVHSMSNSILSSVAKPSKTESELKKALGKLQRLRLRGCGSLHFA